MSKLLCYLFFFCLVIGSSLAQTARRTWSLEDCFIHAEKNNISMKKAILNLEASKLAYKQSKQASFPTANFTTSMTDQFGRSLNPVTYTFTSRQLLAQNYQLGGSMTLFNFEGLGYQKKAEKLLADIAEIDVFRSFSDVKVQIIQYYLQVLLNREKIRISELNILQTKNQLETTQRQYEAGTNTELNVTQLKTKLLVDSMALTVNNEGYLISQLDLKSFLNLNLDDSFRVAEINTDVLFNSSILNYHPEDIYQQALKNIHKRKSDSLKIVVANLKVKANKASLYPSLGLNYNLASTFSSYIQSVPVNKWFRFYGRQLERNFNQQVGLTLNFPIFNQGKARKNYQMSILALKETQIVKEETDNELKKQIYMLYQSAQSAISKLKSSLKVLAGVEKIYEANKYGYEVGGIDYFDLITAQNSLTKSEIDVLNSKYDAIFKFKLLSFFVGIL